MKGFKLYPKPTWEDIAEWLAFRQVIYEKLPESLSGKVADGPAVFQR